MKKLKKTKTGQALRLSSTTLTTSRLGQAVIELAIFGSLILTAFAVLLSHSQSFSERLTLQQQSFRMALRKAYNDNGFVSYKIIKHHRAPDVLANFRQGNRQSISSGSSVLWSIGEPESFSYYQVNEDLVPISTTADVPDVVWNVENSAQTDYSGKEEKQEDNLGITTDRSANIKDTITTKLKIIGKPDVVVTQGLCDNGRYAQACAGNTMHKERIWKTPH